VKPFYIGFDMPAAMTIGDSLKVPVYNYNLFNKAASLQTEITYQQHLSEGNHDL